MTTVDLPVALPWITFGLTWFAIGLLALGIHRLLRQPLARLEPGQRSQILFALAMLPLVVSALVVVLAFSPHVGGLIVDHHCHPVTGCANHVPVFQADLAMAGVWTALIVAATVAAGWLVTARLMRSVALGRMLEAIAGSKPAEAVRVRDPDSGGEAGFNIVESAGVFAYCTGLVRTRVLVSRGLIDQLSNGDLEAVLAHERAHARRRDNLRRLLVALSLCPLPRRWRYALIRDLESAIEGACDREAAQSLGDASRVAAAILAIANHPLQTHTSPRMRMAVLSEHSRGVLEGRISMLCSHTLVRFPRVLAIATIFGAYAITAIVTTRLAHHIAELFII